MNAAWVMWTIIGGEDIQTLTLRQWRRKNFVNAMYYSYVVNGNIGWFHEEKQLATNNEKS